MGASLSSSSSSLSPRCFSRPHPDAEPDFGEDVGQRLLGALAGPAVALEAERQVFALAVDPEAQGVTTPALPGPLQHLPSGLCRHHCPPRIPATVGGSAARRPGGARLLIAPEALLRRRAGGRCHAAPAAFLIADRP